MSCWDAGKGDKGMAVEIMVDKQIETGLWSREESVANGSREALSIIRAAYRDRSKSGRTVITIQNTQFDIPVVFCGGTEAAK